MMKNKAIKNIVVSFGGQITLLALGIIIPRIMLVNYGSDMNGLITTISQIFVYMALLESGIGQAALNALYKPLSEMDKYGVSYVVSIAQSYYRRITRYYASGVILLSIAVPFLLKTDVNKMTIFWIIIFEGMASVVNFYFTETQMTVLTADGKSYVNNTVNVVNKIASNIVKIIMACFGVNIIYLQVAYFVISVIKAIYYQQYFKKMYGWIDYNAAPKNAILKDRNAYILNEIAWTIFSSTDIIILSTFISTQMASVYSVYNLVFSNLNVLLNTVYMSVSYLLGQKFHKDINEYIRVHDAFTSVFVGTMTIFMAISYNLIIPFVTLYTSGITDVEYVYPLLPIMFCLVQILSWSRFVTGSLTGIAGYAKRVSYISLIQAIMNITLSVLFVRRFRIVGVLAATVFAMPIKVIYCAYLSDRVILKRSYKNTIKILGANYMLFAISVLANKWLHFQPTGYGEFFARGGAYATIFFVVGVVFNIIANPEIICFIIKRFRGEEV